MLFFSQIQQKKETKVLKVRLGYTLRYINSENHNEFSSIISLLFLDNNQKSLRFTLIYVQIFFSEEFTGKYCTKIVSWTNNISHLDTSGAIS